jgi:hypothetical protein
MKMKSLLLAAVAVLALSANAQSVKSCASKLTFDMSTIQALEEGGRTAWLPVTLTRDDDATDFTNIQFTLVLPDGLVGSACSEHDDTKVYIEDDDEYVQALGWSSNQVGNEFRTVGVNMKKLAITKNPLILCRIRLTKTAELAKNSVIKVMDLKYTDYADSKYVFCNEGDDPNNDGNFFLVENDGSTVIPGYADDVAVENINAGKAVAGVKYFNVAGVAADEAFEGVNIVVTKYVDGTQSVVKVVK